MEKNKYDFLGKWTRELFNEITYANYYHNRDLAPDITPERWKKIYSNVDEMEKRYQEEKREEKKND